MIKWIEVIDFLDVFSEFSIVNIFCFLHNVKYSVLFVLELFT